jgi:hypothetical protein
MTIAPTSFLNALPGGVRHVGVLTCLASSDKDMSVEYDFASSTHGHALLYQVCFV